MTAVTPSTWRSTIAVILPSVISSGAPRAMASSRSACSASRSSARRRVADVAEVDDEPAHRRVVEPVGHPEAHPSASRRRDATTRNS